MIYKRQVFLYEKYNVFFLISVTVAIVHENLCNNMLAIKIII